MWKNCQNLIFSIILEALFQRETTINLRKAYSITHLFTVERFRSSNNENFSKKLETLHKKHWIWIFFIFDWSVSFWMFFEEKTLQVSKCILQSLFARLSVFWTFLATETYKSFIFYLFRLTGLFWSVSDVKHSSFLIIKGYSIPIFFVFDCFELSNQNNSHNNSPKLYSFNMGLTLVNQKSPKTSTNTYHKILILCQLSSMVNPLTWT